MKQEEDIQKKIHKWIKEQAREELHIPPEITHADKKKYSRKRKHKNIPLDEQY